MDQIYLTPSQAAKELGVTRQTILSYVNKGLLKAIKVGPKNYTKIVKEAVNDYKTLCEVDQTGQVQKTSL